MRGKNIMTVVGKTEIAKLCFVLTEMLCVAVVFITAAAAQPQSEREAASRISNKGQHGAAEQTREGGCKKRFDRFRNRNTVAIEPRTIWRAGTDELKVGVSAIIEGDNSSSSVAPQEIDLLFDSTTNRLRYGNSAEVSFIVDGNRMKGGTAYKSGGISMRQVNEKLRMTLAASRFLEIIAGREVDMKIGETEFTLRREDLEALRSFAGCLNLRGRAE